MKFDLGQTFQVGIFVPGKSNISVNCMGLTTLQNIAKDKRYLYGPLFLYESLESVSKCDDVKEEEEDHVENNQIRTDRPTKVTSVFPSKCYYSFTKLVWQVALIKHFARIWKSSIKLKSIVSLLQGSLTGSSELVKRENFTSELKYLQVSNVVLNQSKLLQLNSILDKSWIKVGGRLKHANLPNQSKYQSILPAKYHSEFLIIQHYHETSYRSGRDQIMSLIRQSYWIVNGKSAVRKILQRCLYCERTRFQQRPPIIADLPNERIGLSATREKTFLYPWLLNIWNVPEQHRLGVNVMAQFLFV